MTPSSGAWKYPPRPTKRGFGIRHAALAVAVILAALVIGHIATKAIANLAVMNYGCGEC